MGRSLMGRRTAAVAVCGRGAGVVAGCRHRRWGQAFGARLMAVCDRGVGVIAVSSSQVGAGVRRAPRRGRRGARRDGDVAHKDLLS